MLVRRENHILVMEQLTLTSTNLVSKGFRFVFVFLLSFTGFFMGHVAPGVPQFVAVHAKFF